MNLNKSKSNYTEIPLSALPDIVFLLLIFFLITTTIDAEKGLGLVLPPDSPIEQPVADKNLAKILINSSGQILINGQITQLNDLSLTIKNRLEVNPKLVASVITDRKTKYEIYIKVIDKLKKAWGNQPARISIAEPMSF